MWTPKKDVKKNNYTYEGTQHKKLLLILNLGEIKSYRNKWFNDERKGKDTSPLSDLYVVHNEDVSTSEDTRGQKLQKRAGQQVYIL